MKLDTMVTYNQDLNSHYSKLGWALGRITDLVGCYSRLEMRAAMHEVYEDGVYQINILSSSNNIIRSRLSFTAKKTTLSGG